jgi:hypothetical protein
MLFELRILKYGRKGRIILKNNALRRVKIFLILNSSPKGIQPEKQGLHRKTT